MGSPALLAAQSGQILARSNELGAQQSNHVRTGHCLVATTVSVQTNDAGGALVALRVNHGLIEAVIDGQFVAVLPAVADVVIRTGTNPGFTIPVAAGESFICTVVVDYNAGTPQIVEGASGAVVAAAATPVAPTDAAITANVGSTQWVRLCDTLYTRTGNTALTQTFDHDCQIDKISRGVMGASLALTEDAFND